MHIICTWYSQRPCLCPSHTHTHTPFTHLPLTITHPRNPSLLPLYTPTPPFLPQIRIAEAAAAQRKLKPSTMGLFVEHAPSEIVLLDCTALDTKDAETTLRTALTPR